MASKDVSLPASAANAALLPAALAGAGAMSDAMAALDGIPCPSGVQWVLPDCLQGSCQIG
jgi:hypothetical protein